MEVGDVVVGDVELVGQLARVRCHGRRRQSVQRPQRVDQGLQRGRVVQTPPVKANRAAAGRLRLHARRSRSPSGRSGCPLRCQPCRPGCETTGREPAGGPCPGARRVPDPPPLHQGRQGAVEVDRRANRQIAEAQVPIVGHRVGALIEAPHPQGVVAVRPPCREGPSDRVRVACESRGLRPPRSGRRTRACVSARGRVEARVANPYPCRSGCGRRPGWRRAETANPAARSHRRRRACRIR